VAAKPSVAPLGWPIEGGAEAWPIYRGSAAHIRDGEGAGCDLGNREGVPWVAVADGVIVRAVANDVQAGNFIDLQWEDSAGTYVLRYCHGQAVEVAVGQQVAQGERIGSVGYTGWCEPPGPAGAHLHIAAWVNGDRVWPETLWYLPAGVA
jgi:murein DD-endopeptidase MepM/ murein hydrolase activator NlpD